jgi:ribokinase
MSILVVGSANIDYSLNVDRLPEPGETVIAKTFSQIVGGKGVNQAVAAARAGGSVTMVACVGDDAGGQILRAALQTEGVVVDHVAIAHASSGVAMVLTAAGGDNMIAVVPGANGILRPSMLNANQFHGKSVVLCQLEVSLETIIQTARLARANGSIFILDPAPARKMPRELLTNVDWLTPNESEVRFLLDLRPGEIDPISISLNLRKMGIANAIIKLGRRGSLLLSEDCDPIFIDAHHVEAIDTTAAGDSFNGAFAVALSEGSCPVDAARFASAASALTVTRYGARDAMPYRPEIDRLYFLGTSAGAAVR